MPSIAHQFFFFSFTPRIKEDEEKQEKKRDVKAQPATDSPTLSIQSIQNGKKQNKGNTVMFIVKQP